MITLDPVQDAVVGSPQVMECSWSTVVGVDPNIVMISWMGPNGFVMNTTSRTIISPTTNNDSDYTSVLRFVYLMEEDEGEYTCNVTILENSEVDSVQLEDLSS